MDNHIVLGLITAIANESNRVSVKKLRERLHKYFEIHENVKRCINLLNSQSYYGKHHKLYEALKEYETNYLENIQKDCDHPIDKIFL